MIRQQGWVSVPVLLLVIMLSALLVRHQLTLNDSSLWQTQREQIESQKIWQDIHQALMTLPAVSGDAANCTGFCRPKTGNWQSVSLTLGKVWLQKQRIERLGVERWCATRDQQWVRCWWHHDSGAHSVIWLAY